MASELDLRARLSRNKLRTNLALLNNASVRMAEKVREKSPSARSNQLNQYVGYDARNWISTYVLGLLLLFTFLVFVIEHFAAIFQLAFLEKPR